jgi:hypothetical protein
MTDGGEMMAVVFLQPQPSKPLCDEEIDDPDQQSDTNGAEKRKMVS